MKIKYIVGRQGTGKSTRIFKEIQYKLSTQKNKRYIILVPEQYTLQEELDFIAYTKLEGIIDVEVLSFNRLADQVFSEIGGLKKVVINELGKIMVLKRLFDKDNKDLKLYGQASKKEGFLEKFSDLIKEFKRNDIYPDDISKIEDSTENNEILSRKLHDINLIYTQFAEYMSDKYIDDEDRMDMLIEGIGKSKALRDTEIWIDGFSGFTPKERRIIEALLRVVDKVNVTLTYSDDMGEDNSIFKPSAKTFNKLHEIAIANGAKEAKTKLEDSFEKSDAISFLEQELYSNRDRVYRDDTDSIEIYKGTNRYSEIEAVACRIIDLVRDKGYNYSDIAVVNGDMDSYGLIIKRILNEYNIPHFIDEKRSIMNNPIIKLTLSLLDVIARDFRYEDVFRMIKTGFTDITLEEVQILENFVLRFGIKGKAYFQAFEYDGVDEDYLEKVNKIRDRFVNPLMDYEKFRRKSSVKDYTTKLYNHLIDMKVEERLEEWIEELKDLGLLEYVNEYTQIWNIMMEVFEQLVEILSDTKLTLLEYKRILETGLKQYEVGIIPPTTDHVLVGSMDRSKSQGIKALFVVGVNDRIIPRAQSDDGLILDDEKEMIKEAGVELLTTMERSDEENFAIYTSFSKPTELLWISYPLTDNEGKALRPSVIIERIQNLFPNGKYRSDILHSQGNEDISEELNKLSLPNSTFKYMVESIRNKLDIGIDSELWDQVYYWYTKNKDFDEKIELMKKGLFHTNQEKHIGQKMSKDLYNMPLKSSVSRLEKFVNCPFAHFINFGLRPKERKEYVVELPDIGLLFHEAMERFSYKLKEEGVPWRDLDRDTSDKLVDRIIEEVAFNYGYNIFRSSNRYKYLVTKLNRVCKRAAWTLSTHVKNGDFEPQLYEVEFSDSKDSHIPAIVLELPSGEEVRLEGRIDRVDIYRDEKGNHVKVIDYKTGKKAFSLSEAYYGLQLQLIVYMDAILENSEELRVSDAHPGGFFYFKLDDPIVEDTGDIEDIERQILKKLKLDGVAVKDINIIKAFDRDMENGKSDIIPVALKKDGSFTKASSALESGEIKELIGHVRNLIVDISEEIIKGNIDIHPCKVDTKVSCEYCEFGAICQFDKNIENNKFRNIKKLKDEDVIKLIMNKDKEETENE